MTLPTRTAPLSRIVAWPAVVHDTTTADDAIAALVTLGYSDKDARDKVEKVRRSHGSADTETLVKAVLQM